MNPEAQYRRYQPDYTGMDLREFPFVTLPDHRGTPMVYKLDLITAPGPLEKPLPVVYFIHGGGFIQPNDKRQAYISRFARDLTAAGYAVVSPDYPVFDDEEHLAAAGGEAAGYHLAAWGVHEAFRFVCENADTLGLDPERAALIGGSAGAMAGFYAIAGYPGDRYRAFVNLWGAPDPLPPLTGFPPVYSVHGDADTLVPYERELPVQEVLAAAGIPHELMTLPGCGHTPLMDYERFMPVILDFLVQMV